MAHMQHVGNVMHRTGLLRSLLRGMCNAGTIRLAIIGDVHSHWYEDDADALESLGVDAAVFIGRSCSVNKFLLEWYSQPASTAS